MHRPNLGSLKSPPVRALATLLALTAPAAAAPQIPSAGPRPTGVTPGIATGGWTVDYNGFAHGLLVLKMHATLNFTPAAYDGQLSYHTAGMIGWMVHNVDDSAVHGHFTRADPADTTADQAVPETFTSTGNLRGTDRVTEMTYQGGNPIIHTLTPNVLLERSAVPPADTAHTIDNLSAIAMLVRQVADTGRCDGNATIFDGRRLTALTARTIGTQALPQTDRSIFSGDSLRCDFQGNQLAGFLKNDTEAAQRRTRYGNAWLASVLPGVPPIPVRVIFENKALGQVTLYLTDAKPLPPGPLAQRGARGLTVQ